MFRSKNVTERYVRAILSTSCLFSFAGTSFGKTSGSVRRSHLIGTEVVYTLRDEPLVAAFAR